MRMKGPSKKRIASYTSPSSSASSGEDKIAVRKGPWKVEEDEVLLKHVNKHGPRDWSSLLSKRLLQRTGKSCRLRWVNKLRPNLKNGCKFSGEEERLVIEMQAQLGNKWAKIATYLPGRTDNDVKNFWSSRQKRLARLLYNSKQPKKTSLSPVESSSKAESSTDPLDYTPIQMVAPLNVLVLPPKASSSTNQATVSSPIPVEQQNLPYLELSNAHEEVNANLDLDFISAFTGDDDPITSGAIDDQELMKLSTEMASYLEPLQGAIDDRLFDQNPLTSDRFFDDLPSDLFDQIEPLPSPPPEY